MGYRADRRVATLFMALLLVLVGGCGSGGSGSDGSSGGGNRVTQSSAYAALGPVANAAAVAFRADELVAGRPLSEQSDAALDAAITDSNGLASNVAVGDYNGPVPYAGIVDSNSHYYDEASGSGAENSGAIVASGSVTGLVDGTELTRSQDAVGYRQGASIIITALGNRSPTAGSWLLAIMLERSSECVRGCGGGSQLSVRAPTGPGGSIIGSQAPLNAPVFACVEALGASNSPIHNVIPRAGIFDA